MSEFRKTKAGVQICPFFIWRSENIREHTEKDVSLAFCTHPDNQDDYEGNCQKDLCPLVKAKKNGSDGADR